MTVYYNELDPFAAAWLRELMKAGQIPDGEVDERSIELVQPGDVRGFHQCHFFAGIGGWAYALRLAGWGDAPVWTGSCPCQPFSAATRGRQVAADMWPAFRSLIVSMRPRVVFGEQVPHARDWFDGLCADLESVDYEVAAAVLPALSVGQDHLRPRIYFACHSYGDRKSELPIDGKVARMPRHCDDAGDVVLANGIPDRVALHCFGNAIVPQVAQVFIEAYLDCCAEMIQPGHAGGRGRP